MRIDFHKYQATGNDFIMIDDRSATFPAHDARLISHLCNRRFGIGSDGLILIRTSTEADFEMVFFNPDASKSFCGNGSRCAVLFAFSLGMVNTNCSFMAIDGKHEAKISGSNVTIFMRPVPEITRYNESEFFIHTGSPHYITYVSNVNAIKIIEEAVVIRYADEYKPGGTNVNFVEETAAGITMRTYERGVEDETLSCGTGVTAAGISYLHKHGKQGIVKVITRGGELEVSAKKSGNGYVDITLTGPTSKVFSGIYEE